MEASVVMKSNKEDIQIICRKMKDAEEPEPLWLRLQKGIDLPGWSGVDGEQVISAVIVKGEEPCEESPKGPKLNEVQQIGLKAFRIAAETYGQLKDGCFNGVATEAWRREFYRLMPVNSEEDEKKGQERRKKAFQRMQEKLISVEYVRPSEDGTGYFPAGPLAGVDEQIFTSRLRGLTGIREGYKDED